MNIRIIPIARRIRRATIQAAATALNLFLAVWLACPPALFAYQPPPPENPGQNNCSSEDPCACPGGSAGGGDTGQQPGSGGSCDSCQPDAGDTECPTCGEDDTLQTQFLRDLDPVLLGRLSAYLIGADIRPYPQAGGGMAAAIAFGRFYASDANIDGPLGPNWTHNYNVTLVEQGPAVKLRTGNASEKTFVWNGSAYDGDGSSQLGKSGSNYVWLLRHGTQFRFDSTNGHRLFEIVDRRGNWVRLAYDYASRLTKVTDRFNRQLSLTYHPGGRLATVTDPLGRVCSYQYDHLGRLTNVTDALGSRAAYAYEGNSARVTRVPTRGARCIPTPMTPQARWSRKPMPLASSSFTSATTSPASSASLTGMARLPPANSTSATSSSTGPTPPAA